MRLTRFACVRILTSSRCITTSEPRPSESGFTGRNPGQPWAPALFFSLRHCPRALTKVSWYTRVMARQDSLQGSLPLLLLKILARRGPLHGYGIITQIENVSEEILCVE